MSNRPSPKSLPIHRAARRGDLPSVLSELTSGIDINVPGANRQRPLHLAVASANLALVQRLLMLGADPNARDREGMTALHWAARDGAIEIAKALLTARAKIDMRGSSSFIIQRSATPLFVAIDAGQSEMAHFLLQRGADPNLCCSGNDESALGLACRRGDADLVEALLAHGARADGVESHDGELPFERPLAVAGSGRAARLLLRAGADVHAPNRYGERPLHWLVGAHHRDRPQLAALALVLRAGADPLARARNGLTPLQKVRSPNAMRLMRAAIARWIRRYPPSRVVALHQARQALLSLCGESGTAIVLAQLDLLQMPQLDVLARDADGDTLLQLLRKRQLRGEMERDEARAMQRLIARVQQLEQVGLSLMRA